MSINFSDGLEDQQIVTSSSVLPEDSGEGSLRPRTITDYIGQEKARTISAFLLTPHGFATSRSTMFCCTALRVWAKRRLPRL